MLFVVVCWLLFVVVGRRFVLSLFGAVCCVSLLSDVCWCLVFVVCVCGVLMFVVWCAVCTVCRCCLLLSGDGAGVVCC